MVKGRGLEGKEGQGGARRGEEKQERKKDKG
jgi:hypothetical protein